MQSVSDRNELPDLRDVLAGSAERLSRNDLSAICGPSCRKRQKDRCARAGGVLRPRMMVRHSERAGGAKRRPRSAPQASGTESRSEKQQAHQ